MSEKTFEAYFRTGMKGREGAYVTKHHDTTEGIADFSVHLRKWGLNTWVELKVVTGWPHNEKIKIWWDHYTEHQALFLRQRDGWLFVRVNRSYFLFSAATAWRMWEAKGFTRNEFLTECHRVWHSNVIWLEFIDAIR